jgi:GH24 family phage-related lysozyme (muramidase)
MYQDSKGLVTVGVGFYLPKVEDAQALDFVNTAADRAATAEEIKTAYTTVASMEAKHGHKFYQITPSIELSAAKFKDLAVTKLKRTYVPALRRFFPDFDGYPSPAQRALIDLAYNGGARGTSELALAEHVNRREWDQAARKVPVRGNDNRRQWRVEMFEDAAQREAAH